MTYRLDALVLRKAAALIDQYGWIQHKKGRPGVGFSLDGAVEAACGFEDVGVSFNTLTSSRVLKILRKRLNNTSPSAWNDVNGRTKVQVTTLLLETAEVLEKLDR